MGTVHNFPGNTHTPTSSVQLDDILKNGGGNDGGDGMLERVKNLENKVSTLSTDVAVIKATMCTKEDLHKELNGQTWKIVIALIVTVLIALLSKYFLK
ncbi:MULTISPECIES: hypothetical protein [unclassified Symbiopectobacterium]|uniref:hypothetical protein n=1 Tax=unclassified Symbiopectobacterium TaxID=2794573 RepID=UPI00222640FB|nr:MULTISPECIES: hypothetical protein [unclassified Symbiopectobacterium]